MPKFNNEELTKLRKKPLISHLEQLRFADFHRLIQESSSFNALLKKLIDGLPSSGLEFKWLEKFFRATNTHYIEFILLDETTLSNLVTDYNALLSVDREYNFSPSVLLKIHSLAPSAGEQLFKNKSYNKSLIEYLNSFTYHGQQLTLDVIKNNNFNVNDVIRIDTQSNQNQYIKPNIEISLSEYTFKTLHQAVQKSSTISEANDILNLKSGKLAELLKKHNLCFEELFLLEESEIVEIIGNQYETKFTSDTFFDLSFATIIKIFKIIHAQDILDLKRYRIILPNLDIENYLKQYSYSIPLTLNLMAESTLDLMAITRNDPVGQSLPTNTPSQTIETQWSSIQPSISLNNNFENTNSTTTPTPTDSSKLSFEDRMKQLTFKEFHTLLRQSDSYTSLTKIIFKNESFRYRNKLIEFLKQINVYYIELLILDEKKLSTILGDKYHEPLFVYKQYDFSLHALQEIHSQVINKPDVSANNFFNQNKLDIYFRDYLRNFTYNDVLLTLKNMKDNNFNIKNIKRNPDFENGDLLSLMIDIQCFMESASVMNDEAFLATHLQILEQAKGRKNSFPSLAEIHQLSLANLKHSATKLAHQLQIRRGSFKGILAQKTFHGLPLDLVTLKGISVREAFLHWGEEYYQPLPKRKSSKKLFDYPLEVTRTSLNNNLGSNIATSQQTSTTVNENLSAESLSPDTPQEYLFENETSADFPNNLFNFLNKDDQLINPDQIPTTPLFDQSLPTNPQTQTMAIQHNPIQSDMSFNDPHEINVSTTTFTSTFWSKLNFEDRVKQLTFKEFHTLARQSDSYTSLNKIIFKNEKRCSEKCGMLVKILKEMNVFYIELILLDEEKLSAIFGDNYHLPLFLYKKHDLSLLALQEIHSQVVKKPNVTVKNFFKQNTLNKYFRDYLSNFTYNDVTLTLEHMKDNNFNIENIKRKADFENTLSLTSSIQQLIGNKFELTEEAFLTVHVQILEQAKNRKNPFPSLAEIHQSALVNFDGSIQKFVDQWQIKSTTLIRALAQKIFADLPLDLDTLMSISIREALLYWKEEYYQPLTKLGERKKFKKLFDYSFRQIHLIIQKSSTIYNAGKLFNIHHENKIEKQLKKHNIYFPELKLLDPDDITKTIGNQYEAKLGDSVFDLSLPTVTKIYRTLHNFKTNTELYSYCCYLIKINISEYLSQFTYQEQILNLNLIKNKSFNPLEVTRILLNSNLGSNIAPSQQTPSTINENLSAESSSEKSPNTQPLAFENDLFNFLTSTDELINTNQIATTSLAIDPMQPENIEQSIPKIYSTQNNLGFFRQNEDKSFQTEEELITNFIYS